MMNDKNELGRDALGSLIKYAGHREAVDPQRTERVEEHVTRHWQKLVQDRKSVSQRKRVAVSGGILAIAASILMAVILLPRFLTPSPVVAEVASTIGIVEFGERGEPLANLVVGSELLAGTVLESSAESGVALNLSSGHSLRMASSSRLRIEADAVVLDRGYVYVDSGPAGSSKPITVRSALATVREVGTQYQVRIHADGLEVSVREGMVNLERNDRVVSARAGEALRLRQDGSVDRESIPIFGEQWSWVSELSTAIDINDRTVADFLDWLSRENGWRVAYATASLQRDARSIQLSGSIDGLDAREALETVMATVGWTYTLIDGVVTIGATDRGTGQ